MSRGHPDPRLDGLARYAVLVARQEAALEDGDVEGFLRHGEEREEIQDLLDALPRLTGADEVTPKQLRELEVALRRAQAADRRIRRMVREHQGAARGRMEELERRTGQLRRYVQVDGAAQRSRSLDLTL
jgi:hypothetical protein